MNQNNDLVLTKTENGKRELEARRNLSAELRHALILVDGHSTLQELLKKGQVLAHFSDSLNTLLQMELISSSSERLTAVSASSTSVPESDSLQLNQDLPAKQQLILLATDLLGKHAGKIIKKIEESSDTKEALLSIIASCEKVIRLVIDETKADTFVISAKDILSGSK